VWVLVVVVMVLVGKLVVVVVVEIRGLLRRPRRDIRRRR